MTDVLKHRFTSPKLDGVDTQQVQPSHWNDGHKFQGGNSGEVLTRDPTDLSFGAKWTPITIPPAVQEVPGGGINGDVLTRDLTVPTFGSKWAAPSQVISVSTTGIVHNFTPSGFGRVPTTIILCVGTAHLTVTGLQAGIIGQRVIFKNHMANAALILFPHGDTGSTSGNRFKNMAYSAPTPVAYRGQIEFMYDGLYWTLIGHEQGSWITPTFNAGSFASSGGWTVTAAQVKQCNYRLQGRTLTVAWSIINASLGAPSVALSIYNSMWGDFSSAPSYQHMGMNNWSDGGASNQIGFSQIGGGVGLTAIASYKIAVAQFAAGTTNVSVAGMLTFEVT